MNEHLKKYIDNGFTKVNGFCPIETLSILDYLDNFTTKSAGALEIGIHHGQFFIALNQLVSESYTSYAVDVFGRQDLNIDASGEGNYQQFINNLKLYDKYQGSNVRVIQGDSTDRNVFSNMNQCHYISVDGGHTPEHVVNDLTVAADLVTNNGVVIVDDYFNHWWPSVTEGIAKYLMTTPRLVPFATSKNKMWMCKLSYKRQYYNYIKDIPQFNKTETKFFDKEIIDLW